MPGQGFRRAQQGVNDLATVRPDIARQWHPSKNGDITPDMVPYASGFKAWWVGDCGHEWQTKVSSRTAQESGCLYCSGKLTLTGVNDIGTLHPHLAQEWDTQRNTKHYGDLLEASNYNAYWVCSVNPEHRWQQRVCNRTRRGFGCPYCAGKHVISGTNDLASHAPHMITQFHPAHNGNMTPFNLHWSSNKKVWWICEKGHEWFASPNSRLSGPREQGCPYCANKRVAAGNNDLATLNPQLAIQWHPTLNGDLTPRDVLAGSGIRAWWMCNLGHAWDTQINDRNFYGTGCPVCSGSRLLVGFNDLATCHPELVEQWHPTKNETAPQSTLAGSNSKVWWMCDRGHEWEAVVSARTSRGDRCGKCSMSQTSLIEQALLRGLQQRYPLAQAQRLVVGTYDRPINVDIYIQDGDAPPTVIEYDGSYWHSKEEAYQRDITKTQALLNAGFTVIRVRETSGKQVLPYLPIVHPHLHQLGYEYSLRDDAVEMLTNRVIDLMSS